MEVSFYRSVGIDKYIAKKKPYEKRTGVTKDVNFWRWRFENLLLGANFRSSKKSALPLHITEQRLFQRRNGFVRMFVRYVLLISRKFSSFDEFSHSQNDRQRSLCHLVPKWDEISAKWIWIFRLSTRCCWLSAEIFIFLFTIKCSPSKDTYSGKCGRYMKHKWAILNLHCTFWPAKILFQEHVPEAKPLPRFVSR